MPQFLERFPEVSDGKGFYKGLMTAMIEFGALIGALNQGWIADKLSRKYSIVIAAIIFVIGAILQTVAVDYAMLTFARFFGGLGVGMLSMVAPLYISEISPPEIRGTLLVLEELSIVTGIVIAFWTTYGTLHIPSEWSWRLPFLIQIFPALVLGVGIVFLPFSPRWLCSKYHNDDALRALSKLRQLPPTDCRIQREWLDIRAEVALHAEISAERHPHLQERTVGNKIKLEIVGWVDLFKKGCWRRTFVGSGLMFFQQVSKTVFPP
jgi:MFS family permease